MVITLIGGSCPAARSTATPWPFCTTSTVIASGTTSSTIACTDHCGTWSTGAASHCVVAGRGSNRPDSATATAPTTSAPMIGRQPRPPSGHATEQQEHQHHRGGDRERRRRSARTRSVPKRRNTPATMPMTIGIGMAAIARRTQPVRPAPASARRWRSTRRPPRPAAGAPSAGPTSTVPGMVQKKASGCRYSQQASTVSTPLRKNTPKIHDASSAWDSPPCGADRQDHRDRPGGREDQPDEAVRRVESAAVVNETTGSGHPTW